METVKIFLSGSMTGLTYEEQIGWRNRLKEAIKYGDYDFEKTVSFFSPPDYYSPSTDNHTSEREAMEFDLYNLRTSDLVVVNLNNPNSIGTSMELILAKENRIPVIALNKDNKPLHPWIEECCTRICYSFRELVEHIVDFYLN